MIIIVDGRALVQEAYTTQFERDGYPAIGFDAREFAAWLEDATDEERASVRACLVAEQEFDQLSPHAVGRLSDAFAAPVMVLTDRAPIDTILRWFQAGVDDVVRKPVHFRELCARIGVHRRRVTPTSKPVARDGRLQVFDDGRDPLIDGRAFPLPRRERCVLEHLASIGERRATKAQLHGAVYGLYDGEIEETVIESHVSKLRRKLRQALGYDPIESRRFLGYRLALREGAELREGTPQREGAELREGTPQREEARALEAA